MNENALNGMKRMAEKFSHGIAILENYTAENDDPTVQYRLEKYIAMYRELQDDIEFIEEIIFS